MGSQSPEYQARVEMLPAYRESLHTRYPPVCESCLPQVEEEIHRKEQMARATALGGWLSKGKERRRRVSGPTIEKERITPRAVYWWRVRGCLFAASYLVSMSGSLGGECILLCKSCDFLVTACHSHLWVPSIWLALFLVPCATTCGTAVATVDGLGSHISCHAEGSNTRARRSCTRQTNVQR